MEANIEEIKKEVESKIGETIDTVYGPSEIIGIVNQNGKEYITLKDYEEQYFIPIEDWHVLLQ